MNAELDAIVYIVKKAWSELTSSSRKSWTEASSKKTAITIHPTEKISQRCCWRRRKKTQTVSERYIVKSCRINTLKHIKKHNHYKPHKCSIISAAEHLLISSKLSVSNSRKLVNCIGSLDEHAVNAPSMENKLEFFAAIFFGNSSFECDFLRKKLIKSIHK